MVSIMKAQYLKFDSTPPTGRLVECFDQLLLLHEPVDLLLGDPLHRPLEDHSEEAVLDSSESASDLTKRRLSHQTEDEGVDTTSGRPSSSTSAPSSNATSVRFRSDKNEIEFPGGGSRNIL